MSDAGGPDKRAEEIKALARDYAETAIETLVDVASNSDAKDAARVMAAKTLLERGFGAPERRVEQKVDVNIYDQRQAHLTALQRLSQKKALPAPEPKEDDIQDAEFEEVQHDKPKSK